MRFTLKQKWLAFGDDYVVHDEEGRPAYTIDGKAFTLLREKLALLDAQGREVALIRERLVSLTPSYEIVREGQRVAVVKRDLVNLFRVGFTVDVPGPDDLEAKGNLIDREYTFTRGDTTVATVSKRWFRLTDTYGVEVAAGQDPVLILASAVIIDLICHPDQVKAVASPQA
jgi:uncharacterized protein YxjI